jgi:hypothetical protein
MAINYAVADYIPTVPQVVFWSSKFSPISNPLRMSQIFVSYSHVSPDRDLAAKLSRSLEANGFDVFIDSKICLGQNWVEQIDVQLRGSTHFIALLSAASIKSDMVRREIAIAYKLQKAKKLTILPVRLGLDEELPYELGAYLDLIQYIVWRPGESFDPICGAILSAVRASGSLSVHPEVSPDPQRFASPQLESVKLELARHLGPVARVIVDRAARTAASWEQLYDLLASEIPPGEERRKFQATRPR